MILVRLAMGTDDSGPDAMSQPLPGTPTAASPTDGHGRDGAVPGTTALEANDMRCTRGVGMGLVAADKLAGRQHDNGKEPQQSASSATYAR